MPDIEFNCPHCNQTLTVEETGAGMVLQCPSCHEQLIVPPSLHCPSCGRKLSPGVTNCIACGHQKPEPIDRGKLSVGVITSSSSTSTENLHCPSCGIALLQNAVLCVNCGLNLKTGRKIAQNSDPEPSNAEASPPSSSVVMSQTKKCPYCAEEILAAAKKCKFCGSMLEKAGIRVGHATPYNSPTERTPTPYNDDANDPAISHHRMFCSSCGSSLAEKAVICPKCGSPTENFKKSDEVSDRTITASYIGGAILPLIGVIMGLYLLIKGKVAHAIGIIVLSIFMGWFWYGFWIGFLRGFINSIGQ